MSLQYHDPNDIEIDEQNERETLNTAMDGDGEFEDEALQNLRESIEETGVVQPPMVRIEVDGEMTAVIGQRRIIASRAADVDEIPVLVMEWDDKEALKASITENIGLFSENVSTQDRAHALKKLWEAMGGEGMPVQSQLGAELGVPRETIRTWLEPLHEGWRDTSIDPSSSNASEVAEDLGEKALAEIRRMTGGGEEGERVAEKISEAGLTQPEIQEVKNQVEDGADADEVIDRIASDEEEEADDTQTQIEITELKLDAEKSEALQEASEDFDSPPAALVVNSIEYFLESEGYL